MTRSRGHHQVCGGETRIPLLRAASRRRRSASGAHVRRRTARVRSVAQPVEYQRLPRLLARPIPTGLLRRASERRQRRRNSAPPSAPRTSARRRRGPSTPPPQRRQPPTELTSSIRGCARWESALFRLLELAVPASSIEGRCCGAVVVKIRLMPGVEPRVSPYLDTPCNLATAHPHPAWRPVPS